MNKQLYCVKYEVRRPKALGTFNVINVFVKSSTKEQAPFLALYKIQTTMNYECRGFTEIIKEKDFKKRGIHR